ncbi:MAG: M20/M25/M40 family metallo-hydrolase [Chloroflexota bacterium]|nr:M20/M25/M40 family metallo-hydrolase [Dehalococcoidia bacterium]MDW8253549.1 M20/M25/M40 family metallo-hydrolase [Chloroflexota bacterium]
MPLDPTLVQYVDTHLERFVRLLERFVAQPSVSAHGEGIEAMASLVEAALADAGLDVVRGATAGNPILLGTSEGASPRRVLFYNHYDVQPADPGDGWESPPWTPTRREGRLFGRGVADNKGNLAARIAAVHALRAVRGTLPAGVTFVVEGEEEIGSPHLPAFVADHRDRLAADGCIWETGGVDWEGAPLLTLGCKGVLVVELRARGANRDLHSSYGPIVPNPAWRLVWALASIKGPDERILVDGWEDDCIPPRERELALADALPDETAALLTNLGLPRFLDGLEGRALRRRLLFGCSATINGLSAGYAGPGVKTILPHEARAKLDFRLVPGQRPADLAAKLRRHLDAHGFDDIEILSADGEPAARSDPDAPFVRLVIDTAAAVYGRPPVISPTMTGAGPMAAFTDLLGLPVATSGCSHPDSRAHGPNENIRLDDFRQAILHAAAILDALPALPG